MDSVLYIREEGNQKGKKMSSSFFYHLGAVRDESLMHECFSLCSYLLSGYTKRDVRSNEATMKYLLMGGASSSILVHGFSWLYGSSGGEIELQEIELGSSFPQPLFINGLLTYTKECGSFDKFLPLYLSLRCLDFSKLHRHAEEKCYPHSDQDITFTKSLL
ncbi:hypothetical protein C4D60_Mb00t10800 [Musa balbisiana]|uniref:NADH:quinone oxidoreductase/Mrp antiporter transmembrane domain-containing protein n=2 Tax=Magnoliopsida TaxID=3398 RepID=A0A4S8I3K5_MUSBA|nr:hypothetical protein C4D60_Mb00t10800 [Musa balbisiana]